jgi:uncharacterized membrane protein (DUF2068 family)
VAIGVGALQLVHHDVGDLLAQLAHNLHFNPESRLVDFIVDLASRLDDRLLLKIGVLVFSCAGLHLIEGIGLYLEQAWAEYLTLLITGSFLPWELFELAKKFTAMRIALLALNLLVFLYLLRLVVRRKGNSNA